MLHFGAGNLFVLLAALIVFFSAFNVMEASLPSLITKAAPPDAKGTAMGLYSSLQFLGIFVGGVVGGFAQSARRRRGGVCAHRRDRARLALRRRHHGATELSDDAASCRLPTARPAMPQSLAAKLRQVPGVAEAVVIAEEKLAYLKVDAKSFDAAMAESLAGAP